MTEQQLDVIAVAHPDDAEIGCGGTLARLTEQGYRVGIVDLTDGEPTPGSPGPEARLAEARQAAEILGAEVRVTLDLPNRRLFDGPDARMKLAKQFRRYRPRLVLGLGDRTPMASPDHYQAMLITEAAVFYSKLTKWDEQFDRVPPHRVPSYMHYFLNFRSLSPSQPGAVVSDISKTIEAKIAAVACYATQFPPERLQLLDRIRVFNQQQGQAAGFEAGEVLGSPTALGTRDLMGLLFAGLIPDRNVVKHFLLKKIFARSPPKLPVDCERSRAGVKSLCHVGRCPAKPSRTWEKHIMKRREFLAASCLAGLAPVAAQAQASAAESAQDKEFYELRFYQVDAGPKELALCDFLKKAAIPALNRIGIEPVGVFRGLEEEIGGLYVLLPHKSLESVATANTRLLQDAAFLKAGATLLAAPKSDPAYGRIESSLLLAFDHMPKLEVPSQKASRVFQLRIYESHSAKKAKKKIEMFNEGGEIAIFRRTGLNPVLFGEALIGAKIPNLIYMLGFDDAETLEKAWTAFRADPGWIELKGDTQYKDTVSNITNILLRPADCSQI